MTGKRAQQGGTIKIRILGNDPVVQKRRLRKEMFWGDRLGNGS